MDKMGLHRLFDALPEEVIARLEARRPVTLVLTTDGGDRTLRAVDPDQWWFWTPDWQAGEREVDAEIAAGKGEIFYSDEEFLAALRADMDSAE